MKWWPGRFLVVLAFALVARVARADDIAPGLVDDSLADAARDALRVLTASLEAGDQRVIPGIYVAVDPSRTDVIALPACDDDGDYVVVLSRALLELVENVAYAAASDELRATHLVAEYGELLARAQRTGAHPLPPPAPLEATLAPGVLLEERAHTFEQSLLLWLVASELAHTLDGDVVCPHPTATHERADDVWTPGEHTEALARASQRMAHVAACDAWATSAVLDGAQPEAPVTAFLDVLAPFEEARARGDSWTYVTLHPGARAEGARVAEAARARRMASHSASETSARRTRMR